MINLVDNHVIQLTSLTLKMTTAQVVKTLTVMCTINNSPTQNWDHPDNHTYSTYYNLWIRIILNEILTKNKIMKHKRHSHQM